MSDTSNSQSSLVYIMTIMIGFAFTIPALSSGNLLFTQLFVTISMLPGAMPPSCNGKYMPLACMLLMMGSITVGFFGYSQLIGIVKESILITGLLIIDVLVLLAVLYNYFIARHHHIGEVDHGR
jgi:hypothetical protein